MQRRINVRSEAGLWMERIVWNAAAGALLAIMILILLGSLQWLDAVAPATVSAAPAVSSAVSAQDANDARDAKESNATGVGGSMRTVGLDRPSG